MTPDALLLALRDVGIRVEADADALRWRGPKDALTLPLAAALKEHKPLLLAVLRTLDERSRDADWETVRAWLIDRTAVTFTPAMQVAASRVLPIGERDWPEAYAHRFRAALRVRGLLLAFGDSPNVVERTGT